MELSKVIRLITIEEISTLWLLGKLKEEARAWGLAGAKLLAQFVSGG